MCSFTNGEFAGWRVCREEREDMGVLGFFILEIVLCRKVSIRAYCDFLF